MILKTKKLSNYFVSALVLAIIFGLAAVFGVLEPVIFVITLPVYFIVFLFTFGQLDNSTVFKVFLVITSVLILATGASGYFAYKKYRPIIVFILLFLFSLINLVEVVRGFLTNSGSHFDGLFF